METFSAFLAICAGNSPVSGEFPTQRPVTRSFNVFFDLRLNELFSEQSWGWWFETLPCPLWRHYNGLCLIVNATVIKQFSPIRQGYYIDNEAGNCQITIFPVMPTWRLWVNKHPRGTNRSHTTQTFIMWREEWNINKIFPFSYLDALQSTTQNLSIAALETRHYSWFALFGFDHVINLILLPKFCRVVDWHFTSVWFPYCQWQISLGNK